MSTLNVNNLDYEFRQILYLIKPHIFNINNPYHIEQYKIWLERLNNAKRDEKFERNKYMVELANQIHDGVLEVPFTYSPPICKLPPIDSYKMRSDTNIDNQWPCYRVDSRPQSPQKRKLRRINVGKPFQGISKTTNAKSESSWYDLSEVSANSTNNLDGGDTDIEEDEEYNLNEKSSSMEQHRQTALKIKENYEKQHSRAGLNKLLAEKVSGGFDMEKFLAMEKDKGQDRKIEEDDEDEKNIEIPDTNRELQALKQRMMDLIEVKNALKDTHSLTQNRKKAIEALKLKIDQLEKRNSEFRRIISVQKKKLLEAENEKAKELQEFKETFANLRNTEIDFLKQKSIKDIKAVEKQYEIKIEELQRENEKKLIEIKKNFEAKIVELVNSHAKTLKQKDDEINKLMNEAKARGDEISTSIDQTLEINHLKRCISKLDKMLSKNEKEYVKKIEKLKQELEMKDTVTQVQLQTQRAEMIVRNSANRHEELNSSLNNLESKYRKMIEDLQQNALIVKKQDEKVIEELKQLLDANAIKYQN